MKRNYTMVLAGAFLYACIMIIGITGAKQRDSAETMKAENAKAEVSVVVADDNEVLDIIETETAASANILSEEEGSAILEGIKDDIVVGQTGMSLGMNKKKSLD